MNKKVLIISSAFVLILIFAAKYIIDRSMIFTGYAAKNLASGIFVANRDANSLEKEDLHFSLVSLSSNEIDYDNKLVKSNFVSFGKQTAIYREGLGCCLVYNKEDFENVKNQKLKLPGVPKEYYSQKWPKGDVAINGIEQYFDTVKLYTVIQTAFGQGNTRSVLIAYDTLAMFEKYAKGFDKNTKILGWSMSKSITSALIGILSQKGQIDINKPAPIKEWQNDKRKNITVKSLLTMTSGLEWDENYGDISDVTKMLYRESNLAKYAINKPAKYTPDSVWYYSSGTSNILTEIIKRKFTNIEDYWKFPYNELFHKISMYNTVFEADASGNFVGSSYTYATTRDWARFGLLYLNNGIWYGDTIISPSWVDFTHKEAPNSNGKYGAQFWLNLSGNELPDAPKDIYYADGYQGQRVYIVPSKHLVIVRMGLTTKKDFDYNAFVTGIINSLKAN